MARTTLRKPLIRTATIKWAGQKKKVRYEAKPALYATVCDNCGEVYTMDRYCNDTSRPGEFYATLAPVAGSNGLHADVCSFTCAQYLFDGEWRKVPYVKEMNLRLLPETQVVRVRVSLTSVVMTEEELVDEWEALEERTPDVQSSFYAAGGPVLLHGKHDIVFDAGQDTATDPLGGGEL